MQGVADVVGHGLRVVLHHRPDDAVAQHLHVARAAEDGPERGELGADGRGGRRVDHVLVGAERAAEATDGDAHAVHGVALVGAHVRVGGHEVADAAGEDRAGHLGRGALLGEGRGIRQGGSRGRLAAERVGAERAGELRGAVRRAGARVDHVPLDPVEERGALLPLRGRVREQLDLPLVPGAHGAAADVGSGDAVVGELGDRAPVVVEQRDGRAHGLEARERRELAAAHVHGHLVEHGRRDRAVAVVAVLERPAELGAALAAVGRGFTCQPASCPPSRRRRIMRRSASTWSAVSR